MSRVVALDDGWHWLVGDGVDGNTRNGQDFTTTNWERERYAVFVWKGKIINIRPASRFTGDEFPIHNRTRLDKAEKVWGPLADLIEDTKMPPDLWADDLILEA